jgi:hypothetical protein
VSEARQENGRSIDEFGCCPDQESSKSKMIPKRFLSTLCPRKILDYSKLLEDSRFRVLANEDVRNVKPHDISAKKMCRFAKINDTGRKTRQTRRTLDRILGTNKLMERHLEE